jgi:hypothetical protein
LPRRYSNPVPSELEVSVLTFRCVAVSRASSLSRHHSLVPACALPFRRPTPCEPSSSSSTRKAFPSYPASLGSRMVLHEGRASLFVAGILSRQHRGIRWESLVVLAFGEPGRWVELVQILSRLVILSFQSLGLVLSRVDLQCFSVVSFGRSGLPAVLRYF